MARAGSTKRSRPFNFRGCDLTAECLPAAEEVRVRFPAAAPIPSRLRVSTQQSLQISAHSGQHRGSLPLQNPKSEGRSPKEIPTRSFEVSSDFGLRHSDFHRGRGRQAMHLPCKQANMGALPTDSTFYCGKLDQCTERSLINFFRWV